MFNHTLLITQDRSLCFMSFFFKLKHLSLSPLFLFCSVCPCMFLFLLPHRPPCERLPRYLPISPLLVPGCLFLSGGCWGSSQSCKRGSPPGWPRHSVVQVRKTSSNWAAVGEIGGSLDGILWPKNISTPVEKHVLWVIQKKQRNIIA